MQLADRYMLEKIKKEARASGKDTTEIDWILAQLTRMVL
jgi:hypothetical protein